MHMELVYRDRVLIDTNHIEFCQLPQKYDIDLEQLRNGLRSVEAFERVKLNTGEEYPDIARMRRITGTTKESDDSLIPIEGYSGICFKSEKGMENDLYQGLSSNVLGTGARKAMGLIQHFDATVRNDIWFPYLTEIERMFNGQVTQMRLLKLHARHNLGSQMHTDYPWYKGLRFHIPLTDELVYKWRVMKTIYEVYGADGHMYYLNVGKPHMPMNDHSDLDRWVFNVNLQPHTLEIPLHEQLKQGIL